MADRSGGESREWGRWAATAIGALVFIPLRDNGMRARQVVGVRNAQCLAKLNGGPSELGRSIGMGLSVVRYCVVETFSMMFLLDWSSCQVRGRASDGGS